MSVLHRKEPKGNAAEFEKLQEQIDKLKEQAEQGGAENLQKQIDELKAAAEQAAAFSVQTFQTAVISDRAAGLNLIDDSKILAAGAFVTFPEYQDGHQYQHKGEIITYNGRTYEVIAPHTSNAAAYPVETTFAYYRLVELEHTGSLTDPIPYPETPGIVVNVKNGLYYSYKGSTYQAKADMPNCVYPPDTPGMWQWSKVE